MASCLPLAAAGAASFQKPAESIGRRGNRVQSSIVMLLIRKTCQLGAGHSATVPFRAACAPSGGSVERALLRRFGPVLAAVSTLENTRTPWFAGPQRTPMRGQLPWKQANGAWRPNTLD